MNRTECEQGFATDGVIILEPSSGVNGRPACAARFDIYVAWVAICVFFKFITAIGISYDWHISYVRRTVAERHNNYRTRQNGFLVRRLPLVPALQWVQAVLLLAFVTSTSTNACSSATGCALSLFAAMQFTSGLYNVLLIKKFVRLGRRMIPLTRPKVRAGASKVAQAREYESTASTDSVDPQEPGNGTIRESYDSVSREDGFLRMVILIRFVAEVVNFLLSTAVQSFKPRLQYDTFASSFFAISAFCMLMSLVAYIGQLERLIAATKAGCIQPYKKDILRAISKMKRTEASYAVIHLSVSILYILVSARIVAPDWFIMAIIITFETASTTITFFWFVVQKYLRKRDPGKESKTSSKREWGEKKLVGAAGPLTVLVDAGSLCEIIDPASSPRSSGSKEIPTALG